MLRGAAARMFFPLRDHNPTRRFAWVTYALMGVNLWAFVWLLRHEAFIDELTLGFGLIPARFMADPIGDAPTVITSMFLHGGWWHLISNLWCLWMFGDNLEEALGRGRYALFYATCGIAAAAAQIAFDPSSRIPMVGASGAIAGVVGGYVVLYPRAPISALNLMPLLWLFLGIIVVLPAWAIALLFMANNVWMALQSVTGLGSAGVAFAAHIGGFLGGFVLIKAFHVAPRPQLTWRELPRDPRERRW